MKLKDYQGIDQLKSLNKKELEELSESVREELIELAKTKKIHLSSNLGIVELTISLLKHFNLPVDKINYDTGHQSYVHKILTDRKDLINTIRTDNGISGFPDPDESPYDFISSGHSSTSLSIGQGYIENVEGHKLVTVIGDAAISNGLALEALNNISYNKTKMIIVLNDNEMSISKNTGALFKVFSKMKNTNTFFSIESWMFRHLGKRKLGAKFCFGLFALVNKIERFLFGKNIFHNLNFFYIGPINGHKFRKLDKAIERAKIYSSKGPVVLHIKTQKGKGLEKPEDPKYHSINLLKTDSTRTFSAYAANKMEEVIKKNQDIRIINSAMTYSAFFEELEKKYPNNYEDVGINEEHSVTKSAGITLANKRPYVMLYSTFLQRTYDEVLHDLARLKLPVAFLIDRADVAYQDGDTHHGIYDVGMLKSMPNTIITCPSNKDELEQLIDLSLENKDCPFFIRYPNEDADYININDTKLKFGDWKQLTNKKTKTCIISYGPVINEIYETYKDNNVDIINAVFLTKYDKEKVKSLIKKYDKIIFFERIYRTGTLYYDVVSLINELGLNVI